MLTPEQSRAARGLLDWSQTELAKRSNLSESTIRDFEKGRRVPSPNNLAAIIRSFEDAGVEIIGDGYGTSGAGVGVRLFAASHEAELRAKIGSLEYEVYRLIERRNECDKLIEYYRSREIADGELTAHIANEITRQQNRLFDIDSRIDDIERQYKDIMGADLDPISTHNRIKEKRKRRSEERRNKSLDE